MVLISGQYLLIIFFTTMGLILTFLGLFALWIMISITTVFFLSQNKKEQENEQKKRAAAIAVAVALAENQKLTKPKFPLPSQAFVSAWQAVLRSNILNKRGHVR